MFSKALIANRGEIACRIIRTMRKMGVESVAVYSEADRDALHVELADEAVAIGASPASESYLSIDRLIAAARRSGAEAVHPGYGFLSESAEFAERCRAAGLVFVGPSPEAMRMVGSKSDAKTLMARIGAPTLEGYHGDAQDEETFLDAARRIGFPVVVKASAGGGGRGMRVVTRADELAPAMASARREALLAFGDGRLLLEKYLARPRHVEIQLVADNFGNVTTFPERDCSLQRNHQKLVEETPAPALAPETRRALRATAAKIARAAGYAGAGTVEFLLAGEAFYFLEVNARLQVEHPVTEMVSGVDLVDWQLRIAAGEKLPASEEELPMRGVAIEARICAEDPAAAFRPASGMIAHLRFPRASETLRIETGVRTGDEVSPYYDSLLAKLVVGDETREGALRKMQKALDDVELVGIASNLDFLRRLLAEPRFVAGDMDTRLVDAVAREPDPTDAVTELWILAAAVFAWRKEAEQKARALSARTGVLSPWAAPDAWRQMGSSARELGFRLGDKTLSCSFGLLDERRFWMSTPSGRLVVAAALEGSRLSIDLDGARRTLSLVARPGRYVVVDKGRNYSVDPIDPLAPPERAADAETRVVAPLPARVTRVFVRDGDAVTRGAPILVLEAMKMEIPINAPRAGVVESVLCSEGQSVREGQKLVAMGDAD
jgi:3-methylcrotonyl-CoA carboxylase alpha subunit